MLGFAAEQARAADVVTTHVHQRAAVDVGAQADVRLVVEAVGECRPDQAQLSDQAFVHELGHALRLRVVPPHERLAEVAPGALGDVEGLVDLLGMARERLLAQDVLAGLE